MAMAIMKRKVRSSSSVPLGGEPHSIIHEGWCVKESGTALFGKTNWRRRWFRLIQTKRDILLQYYRNVSDRLPAGSIRLDVTYCTRQLESHEKPQANCFAVGPLIDDGATRTYYISCPTPLAMQEWMAVIDAAIQGVPEQAHKRRETVSKQFRLKQGRGIRRAHTIGGLSQSGGAGLDTVGENGGLDLSMTSPVNAPSESPTATIDDSLERDDLSDDEVLESGEEGSDDDGDSRAVKDTISATRAATVGGVTSRMRARAKTIDSTLKPTSRLHLYDYQTWRMEHWRQLRESLKRLHWSRVDTKDGITVARCKFGSSSNGQAIIKVEGVLPADPNTVYQFLKISTKDGGKLDYIFRNELLLQEFDADEPQGTIIFNQFLLPLPRVSTRDVVAMKLWIPEYLNDDGSSGFVMFSVDHPEAPIPEKDSKRILIESSGFVLQVYPGPDGKVYTHMAILLRVAFFGALHRMLKGAYNSGLLKIGLRTTFQHIGEQLQRFVEITDI